MISKLLVANRGEIALRIIRTAKNMGVSTVAVYSDEEGFPMHAAQADDSFSLGSGSLRETYLNIEKIISVATRSGVDAIHPGYGFLSENTHFAEAVELAGFSFVGPTPASILTLGNKLEAKSMAQKVGIPTLPPATGTLEEIILLADKIGYPVLVKPAGGGGGKGMHIAHGANDIRTLLERAMREASSSFGNAEIYLEKFVPGARHVEVQIVGDGSGNIIHLFDRECSIQRRYQKIVEEAPSPTLNEQQRTNITGYAMALASAVKYRSAGTVEFILDEQGDLFFLEMNTRIQVEHPVTEMITGVDIVKLQLEVAMGQGLSVAQKDIKIRGHAIELRLYAEDPENDFSPSTGTISDFNFPVAPWFRVEHALRVNEKVTGLFDPMLCKMIIHGENRAEAIARMRSVLRRSFLHGITTNLGFLSYIVHSPLFASNNLSVDTASALAKAYAEQRSLPIEVVAGYALIRLYGSMKAKANGARRSVWSSFGAWEAIKRMGFYHDDHFLEVTPNYSGSKVSNIQYNGLVLSVGKYLFVDNSMLEMTIDGVAAEMHFTLHSWGISITHHDRLYRIKHANHLSDGKRKPKATRPETGERMVTSPLHGRIISLPVKEGEIVELGTTLMIIEAMKMENLIASPQRAKIGKVLVREMEQVSDGSELIVLEKL